MNYMFPIRKKLCFPTLTLTLISIFALQAYAAEKLSLIQAVELLLKNNYSVSFARNELDIDRNNVDFGNAGFLPKLDVTAQLTKGTSDTKQEYANGTISDKRGASSTTVNAGAALSWTLFDGMKMFVSFDKFQANEKIGEWVLKDKIETTIAQLMNIYYQIVNLNSECEMSREIMDISRRRLDIADTRYKAGASSKLEYLQAKLDFNSDSSAFIEKLVRLANLKISLNELLARDKQIDFVPSDSINLNSNLNLPDVLGKAEKNNTQIRIAALQKEIAGFDFSISKSKLYPVLGFFTNYNYTKSSSQAGFVLENQTKGINFGLNFSYNLFNGFTDKLQVENAEIAEKSADINCEDVRNKLESDISQAFNDYKRNTELLEFESENLMVAGETLSLATEQYKAGAFSGLQFREAQNSYISAQMRYLNAIYSAKTCEIELLRLSGSIVM